MAPPGMFAGRTDEIDFIEGCLRQAKHGNPKHFLLTGERGIGKSSLVLFEQYSAQGLINTKKDQKPLKFFVVSVSLRKEDTFLSIMSRIANGLRKEVARNHDVIGNFVMKSLDVLSRFEAAGVKFNHAPKATEEEAFASLQDDFEETILKMGDAFDGIFLLIDEADGPLADAGLGMFCKLLTEEMAKRRTDRICIGLAGLPSLTAKLAENHESSLRLFHILTLKPLEPAERRMVIDMGLDNANKTNPEPVTIDEETLQLLSSYSEGYPHFLQEFAFCAFEADSDNVINKADFFQSLFSENGAFDQLGVKYFDKAYATPSSDDYRRVLHAMSENLDDWTSRADIITGSGLKGGTVDNALRALKQKNIIVPDDLRAGYYRLPTRSFAAWINIKKRAEAS